MQSKPFRIRTAFLPICACFQWTDSGLSKSEWHFFQLKPKGGKGRYETRWIAGRPRLVIHPKNPFPGAGAIMFLHGGGDRDTWKPEVPSARTYADRSGMTVFYPIHAPMTEASIAATADYLRPRRGGGRVVRRVPRRAADHVDKPEPTMHSDAFSSGAQLALRIPRDAGGDAPSAPSERGLRNLTS